MIQNRKGIRMHFVKVKGILSSKNGMNLFRGCTYGCIYCDSRSKCYQMNHSFEDIEVKEGEIVRNISMNIRFYEGWDE